MKLRIKPLAALRSGGTKSGLQNLDNYTVPLIGLEVWWTPRLKKVVAIGAAVGLSLASEQLW